MRCFIAVDFDELDWGKVGRLQGEVKRTGSIVKFVERENLHITVKFLGDISEDDVMNVKERLNTIKGRIEPFKAELKGIGCFGRGDYIRTIFVNVNKGHEELVKLIKSVCEAIGQPEEAVVPHLTVGRVKSVKNGENLLKILGGWENEGFGEVYVKSVKLKSSILMPGGPVYNDISEVGF